MTAQERVDATVALLSRIPYTQLWHEAQTSTPEAEWLQSKWLEWRRSLGCTSGWPPGAGHIEFHAWLSGGAR